MVSVCYDSKAKWSVKMCKCAIARVRYTLATTSIPASISISIILIPINVTIVMKNSPEYRTQNYRAIGLV